MKTPDEIKKGLEGLKFVANAGRIDDALSYIQQLEEENARLGCSLTQLSSTISQLETENKRVKRMLYRVSDHASAIGEAAIQAVERMDKKIPPLD